MSDPVTRKSALLQHSCQRRHRRTADSDEVNVFLGHLVRNFQPKLVYRPYKKLHLRLNSRGHWTDRAIAMKRYRLSNRKLGKNPKRQRDAAARHVTGL